MEQITIGYVRVQLLNENIVRLEAKRDGKFFDDDSFFIPDKGQYRDSSVLYTREDGVICFGEYELYISENAKSLKARKEREKSLYL